MGDPPATTFFNSAHLGSQQWELFRSGSPGLGGADGEVGVRMLPHLVGLSPGKLQAPANLPSSSPPSALSPLVVLSLLGRLSTHFFSLIKNLSGGKD